MKKNITRIICSVFSFILFFTAFISCKTTQPAVDSKDLSYIYNPTKNPINPRYNVLNKSDELSVLSIKFFASDLFFSEANPTGLPTSQMLIAVKLYNISQGRQLADTAYL